MKRKLAELSFPSYQTISTSSSMSNNDGDNDDGDGDGDDDDDDNDDYDDKRRGKEGLVVAILSDPVDVSADNSIAGNNAMVTALSAKGKQKT